MTFRRTLKFLCGAALLTMFATTQLALAQGSGKTEMLWLGQAISILGDQFHLIALPWLVLQLTGDALATGTVGRDCSGVGPARNHGGGDPRGAAIRGLLQRDPS